MNAKAVRALLMLAVIEHRITLDEFVEALTEHHLCKETDMHRDYTAPTAGDIGEEEEEWEVLPTHQPIETPAPEPVPAP